jgi:hypothetical protein
MNMQNRAPVIESVTLPFEHEEELAEYRRQVSSSMTMLTTLAMIPGAECVIYPMSKTSE